MCTIYNFPKYTNLAYNIDIDWTVLPAELAEMSL